MVEHLALIYCFIVEIILHKIKEQCLVQKKESVLKENCLTFCFNSFKQLVKNT